MHQHKQTLCLSPSNAARVVVVGLALFACANLRAQMTISKQATKIDWEAADAHRAKSAALDPRTDPGVRASFPSESDLNKVKIPVLLLGVQDKVRSAPRFRQQDVSYVGYYQLNGAVLSVLGTGIASDVSDANIAKTFAKEHLASADYTFDALDDSTDLSFERFGAAYTLRLSCAKDDDERCTKPEFLRSLAEALSNVGGKPR